MAPPGSQALTFTLQTPPTGDLNHFVVEAIVPKPPTLASLQPASGKAGEITMLFDPLELFEISEDPPPLLDVSGVIAKYQSLSGNKPATYGNSVALWESLSPDPSTTPLVTVDIPTNDQIGEAFFDYGLGPTDYCVTYQLGSSPQTMCALAQISYASPAAIIPLYVSIEILSVTTETISVQYDTLPGYLPATYKNWIGIWPGFALPYNAPPPLNQAPVTLDYTQGILKVPFTQIASDYTMILFHRPR